MKITSFFGRFRFLSNFYPCNINGWPSVEHAYQVAKAKNISKLDISYLKGLRPGEIKKFFKNYNDIRDDWDEVKLGIMEGLLRIKFSDVNPGLKNMLINSDGCQLIEGNTWGDTFWGVCKGVGENNLGRLLMKIRKELTCG